MVLNQFILVFSLFTLSSCAHKLYTKLSEEELQQFGKQVDMLIGDCENVAILTGEKDGSTKYELAFNNCITEKASSYDTFRK